MKLFLVRHAQPDRMGYHNLPPGPGLGPTGVHQAMEIAQYLHKAQITRAYSSDYRRTLETAVPLQKASISNFSLTITEAIREREPSIEPHESLQLRVTQWFEAELAILESQTSVIFSHCGPINMMLAYLDPDKSILQYPYICEHGCLTPLGAIWALDIMNHRLKTGKLAIPWKS